MIIKKIVTINVSISAHRQEMAKYRSTGEPSTWEHFEKIHEILKESKLVNLSLCMKESFGKETYNIQ